MTLATSIILLSILAFIAIVLSSINDVLVRIADIMEDSVKDIDKDKEDVE